MNLTHKTIYSRAQSMLLAFCMLMGVQACALSDAQPVTGQAFHLDAVFSDPASKRELSQFIDNVLRQIPSEKFFSVIQRLKKNESAVSDAEWYTRMLENSSKITPRIRPVSQIKALKHQKGILSKQIVNLLGVDSLKKVLEIGTPGTYVSSIKDKVAIRGTIYSLNEKKRSADALQAFSYNPRKGFAGYDRFIAMNDYAPISEEDVPSNSIDAIICVIGLHHIPEEKIDPFIASIRRVLRPNGVLILREHNAFDEHMYSIVYAAHSVFNVIMNTDSLATELAEYRNFRPLDYWIERVEKHGFSVGTQRLLQQGDPTLNTMIRFTKKA